MQQLHEDKTKARCAVVYKRLRKADADGVDASGQLVLTDLVDDVCWITERATERRDGSR